MGSTIFSNCMVIITTTTMIHKKQKYNYYLATIIIVVFFNVVLNTVIQISFRNFPNRQIFHHTIVSHVGNSYKFIYTDGVRYSYRFSGRLCRRETGKFPVARMTLGPVLPF